MEKETCVMESIKNYRILSLIFIGIILLLWLPTRCGDSSTVKVTTPEIKGTITNGQPVTHEPISSEKTIIKWRDRPIQISKHVDTVEVVKYIDADTITKFEMFSDAVTLRKFSKSFEDNYLKADISGTVKGYVQDDMKIDYTIKPQTVDAEVKQTVFRLLLGGEVQNTLTLDKFTYKGRLSGQLKNGDIISTGYGRSGGQHLFSIGFDKSIFNVKK